MKRLATILFALLLLGCNITPALSHILVGDWLLEHYEAYLDGTPTSAVGSRDSHLIFTSNGRCSWNGKSTFDYSLDGNTITLYNERKTIEYKVTHYTETFLVMYFYIDRYKMVYYMEKF